MKKKKPDTEDVQMLDDAIVKRTLRAKMLKMLINNASTQCRNIETLKNVVVVRSQTAEPGAAIARPRHGPQAELWSAQLSVQKDKDDEKEKARTMRSQHNRAQSSEDVKQWKG